MALGNFASFNSKQDHPGSPFHCHDYRDNPKPNEKGEEIYDGLVGIAFETQENDNLEFTQFVNVQGHRVWIESIVNGKKIGIQMWSNSMGNDRIAKGNSRTSAMNFPFVIWF